MPSAPHDPPFRADHVGSFLRPPQLLSARADREAGRISAADLRAIEDDAIADVVRFQESLGLRSITDGEYRRAVFYMGFYGGLGGVSATYDTSGQQWAFVDRQRRFTPPSSGFCAR
jgi:5-methyltetrahydropteroyltriglutamate--homocysteine methyltransferase